MESPYPWVGMQVFKTPPNHKVFLVTPSGTARAALYSWVRGRSGLSTLAFALRAGSELILFFLIILFYFFYHWAWLLI